MHDEVKKMLAERRKDKTNLSELRALQIKLSQQKAPDQKTLKLVNDEMNKILERMQVQTTGTQQ